MTFTPDPPQGIAPIRAEVDPHLWTLTERWESWSTSGEVPVGDLLRQVLIDDPQAPMRLTYVSSQLHVTTVVSTAFYRPNAHQASYQLTVRVESLPTGAGQAWLEGRGESRNLASAGWAARDASIQAVQDLSRKLVMLRGAHDHRRQAAEEGMQLGRENTVF